MERPLADAVSDGSASDVAARGRDEPARDSIVGGCGDGAAAGFAIGGIQIEPNVILAPMSGITDSAYRTFVKEANPGAVGLVVTELISIEALARQDLKTHRMLRYLPHERPLAMQLFGAQPTRMAEASAIAQDLGADIIDVNCGCPAPKVTKRGGGAGLMREPDVLREILRALRRTLTIPYTVKLRAGWDDASRNAVEVARMAEGEGAAMIAVHGRTRKELYSGEADWDLIAEVKRAVRVPVVGSGDIMTAAQGVHRLENGGVDGVMIGRGTLGNPWVFREIAALRRGEAPPVVSSRARFLAIDALIARLAAELHPATAIGRARGLGCRMVKYVHGGAQIRALISRAPSVDAMRAILQEHAERAAKDDLAA